MAKNLNQIATAAASLLATDKMYIARSPFGVTDDRYILGSSLITQFADPLTTKGDLFTFSTVNARLPVGTVDGQILQVNSAAAVGLAWSTPAYPSTSGSAGKILISDGTNNIYSTPTYPNTAGTSGSIIISDGTNKINSTSLWPNTVGTALHLVLSNGTSNVYSTPAYPNASVTAGKFIISDGTNYIASTSIMPNTVGAAGTIIRSDGTVNTYSTSTFADTYLVNNILYASSANTVTGLATLASGVLVTSAGGVPSISTTLPAGLTIPGYQTTLTLPLSLANGGTNASLVASTGGIFYSTASAGAILSGTATARQMLQSGATAAPSWSTSTWPATTTANQILYSSAINTVSEITAAASSVLITSAGSVPSLSQTLPSIVQGNITTVGTITSGTWNGSVIGLTYGGTNAALTASTGGIVYSGASAMAILAGTATAGQMVQSGSTAAPTWSTSVWPATTTAGRLLYSSTNNNVTDLTTTARAVLGSSSTSVPNWLALTDGQLVIGSTAGAPAAASLSAGSGITITPGSNTITIAASGGSGSPLTTKGDIYTFSTVNDRLPVATGDGKILQVLASASTGLAYSTPTYPSASGTSGKFLISDGTNNVYSTSTIPTSAGATANKVLLSDGTNYVLSTPTFPNASATSGKIIISDGTNWIASTPTYPNTSGTAGKILRSDGTNNVYTTSTFADTYTASNLLYSNGANTVTGLATANSGVLVTDASGVPSISTTIPKDVQHVGTTSAGNATAGDIGEVMTSNIPIASKVSVSNNTAKNVTSLSLTAGDWDVYGNVTFTIGGSCTVIIAWTSTTSATLPDNSLWAAQVDAGGVGNNSALVAPILRVNVNTTTTVYLGAYATFSTSTVDASGTIYARRVR